MENSNVVIHQKQSSWLILVPLLIVLCIEIIVFDILLANRPWESRTELLESGCRFSILLGVAYAAYLVRPTGYLANTHINSGRTLMAALLASIVLWGTLSCGIALRFDPNTYLSGTIPAGQGERVNDYRQYNHLANSLLKGLTYLDLDVPDWLADMENPYDAGLRRNLALENKQPYLFDYAYFDGKYHCYFGVLPALVAFVPYKLITGSDLRTDVATALFCIFSIAACAFFLLKLLQKYWPDSSIATFLLLHGMLIMGLGILTQAFIPFFYALPPLAGLACILFGLGFWLGARKSDSHLSKANLIAGSTAIALSMGCRPQMFLAVLLAFPIFWNEIVKERRFFSRDGLANTLCVMLPCFTVAIPIMAYNWARFHSVTDFGASYNLTGFDMTAKAARGFSPKTAAIGLFYYLFVPPNPQRVFPFFEEAWRPQFSSSVPIEPYHASFIWCAPANVVVFMLPFMRKKLSKDCLLFVITCLVLAIVLMVISPQVASISMRYFTDFGWSITIACILMWGAIQRSLNSKRSNTFFWIMWALILLGIVFSLWILLCDNRYHALSNTAPQVYDFFKKWFVS